MWRGGQLIFLRGTLLLMRGGQGVGLSPYSPFYPLPPLVSLSCLWSARKIFLFLPHSLFPRSYYFVWLRITDEGSVPEMRIWSILLIKSDLKWCIHLSRSLFLYFSPLPPPASLLPLPLFSFLPTPHLPPPSVHPSLMREGVCNYVIVEREYSLTPLQDSGNHWRTD